MSKTSSTPRGNWKYPGCCGNRNESKEWVPILFSFQVFPRPWLLTKRKEKLIKLAAKRFFLNFRSLRCLAYNSEAFQCITIMKLLYLFIYISKLPRHFYLFLNNAEPCFTSNNVIFSHIPLCILKPTVKIPTRFTKRCVSNNLWYVFNYDLWESILHVMLCYQLHIDSTFYSSFNQGEFYNTVLGSQKVF